MKKLSIIGCGGHARSVCDVAMDVWEGIEITFYDENAKADETIMGGCLVKSLSLLTDTDAIVAYGDVNKRESCEVSLKKQGKRIVSVVSLRSDIGHYASLGEGCFIAHRSHIGPEAVIGDGCIINTSAVVEHEVKIGDYSSINVNATVCGRCKIGKRVYIGAGAVIKDNIRICDDVIVGAGAVVVKDINVPGVYVGCPARKRN